MAERHSKLRFSTQRFRMLVFSLIFAQLTPEAYAQSVPQGGTGTGAGGSTGPTGVNLDLSSSEKTAVAPNTGSAININLGGSTVGIAPGQMITPAELVAVNQVLAGTQTIQLSATGNAIGGTVNLGSANSFSNMFIPSGVTALHDFASSQSLNIAGNFTNAGTFYAFSSATSITGGAINALNIINQQGGLLSSILPSGGYPGITSAVSNFNLTLNAVQNIVNYGSITSSGTLTATAGGSIINAVSNASSTALMQAINNVNLQAANILNSGTIASQTAALNLAAANITNSGLLQSVASNINVNTLLSNTLDLSIVNDGGVLQALAGSINLGNSLSPEAGNLSLHGGNIDAREINSYGRHIDIDVTDLRGTLNLTGSEAHVSASTQTLSLGNIELSGDPTFFNRLGDVQIGGNLIYYGQALAIVAAGDIVSNGGNPAILTSNTVGNGGDITMIAGAKFTGPASGSDDTTSLLTLSGGSISGGSILLNTANPISQLDSSSSATNGSAGNITLVAFAGTTAGSGTISLPQNMPVLAHGSGAGNNGNVTLIAGATSGTAITIGPIRNDGGAAGTGDIVLRAATPSLTSGTATVQNGTLTGSFSPGAVQDADISMRDFVAGHNLSVSTGGNITLSGSFYAQNGGSISLVAGRNITDNVLDIGLYTNTANGSSAGGILMAAGAAFTQTDTSITLTGASSTGGSISFAGISDVRLDSSTGNGGNFTALALAGGTAGSGAISLHSFHSAYRVFTAGATRSGDITIMAGNTSGAVLDLGGVWTEGSATSTGGAITITPAAPVFGGGVTYDLSTVSISSGTLTAGPLTNSDIRVAGHLVGNGTSISLITPGNITVGGAYGEGHLGNYFNDRGGSLTLVAGGDISDTGTDLVIKTRNLSGDGGGVLMAAGAAFTLAGNTVTINGASTTGGSLSIGSISQFNTSGTARGGTVTALAFNGSAAGSGRINLPPHNASYSITTSGGTVSGDFTALAGATNGAPLYIGGIWTEGDASSTGGAVTISASTPVVAPGTSFDLVTGLHTGSLTAGAMQSSDIYVVGGIITNGINTNIATPGNIYLGAGYGQGSLGGYYNSKGGTITLVAGKNIIDTGTDLLIRTANSTGNGGGIVMVAGANVVQSASTVSISGPSSTGGRVSIAGVTQFNTSGSNEGGDVTILAFAGTDPLSGRISLPSYNQTYDIRTGGVSRSGDVTILAGASDGTALTLGGISTEGSATSTGGAINVSPSNPVIGGGVSFDLNTGRVSAGSISRGPLQNSSIILQGNLWGNGTNFAITSLQDIIIGNGYGNGHLGNYFNTRGGSISLVAGGNLLDNGFDLVLKSSNNSGDGGGILMVAGASFTEFANLITISGASATGGSVIFGGVTQMNSSGLNAGGDITLIAFNGSTAGSGRVQLNPYNANYNIYTGGSTRSGNFTALAGATSGAPLTLGGVFTEGAASAFGGAINIAAATPVTGGGVSFDRNTGAIVIGALAAGAMQSSDVTLRGDLITNGGSTTILSLGNINLGAGYSSGHLGNWNYPKGGSITLIAGGDITDTGSDLYLRTATSVTGGNLSLIAGAAFTKAGNTVTVNGASASGGSVRFPGGITAVSTDAIFAGDVNVVAFAGAKSGSGQVFMPAYNAAYNIYTRGQVTNGSVTVLAGATGGETLHIGGVWVEGTYWSTGGSVLVSPSTPQVGAGVSFDLSAGKISSGSFSAGALQNSDIILRGSLIGTGAGVSLISLGNIQLGAPGSDFGSAGIWHHLHGTPVLLVAGGDIIGNGTSNIYIASGSDGNGTKGGAITIAAGAAFTVTGNNLTITGASATGGSILYSSLQGFYSNIRGPQGDGGDVTLVAYSGSKAGSGNISLPGNYTLTTGGAGTGVNGNVDIVAGASSGTITVPVILTTGGTGGAGNVHLQSAQPNSPVSINISSAALTAGSFLGASPSGAKLTVTSITAAGMVASSGILNTPTVAGAGVPVSITAGGPILLEELIADANGSGAGGGVTLSSGAGITATGIISTREAGGNNSGSTTASANGAIFLTAIDTTGDAGGAVQLSSKASSISVSGNITTSGLSKSSGTVVLDASTTITLNDVVTTGTAAGAITATANGTISGNSLVASGTGSGGGGAGADINVTSLTGDVVLTGAVDSHGFSPAVGPDHSAGAIRINAGHNALLSAVTAAGGLGGRGGDIIITAGSFSPGQLKTGSVTSSSSANGAGKITLTSTGSIVVNGTVDSSCDNNVVGKLKTIQGGNITLTSGSGLTVTGAILSSSLSGPGGVVRLTNGSTGAINVHSIDTQSTGAQLGGISTGFLNPVSGEVYITQQSTGDTVVAGSITAKGSNYAFGSDVRISLSGGQLDVQGTIDLSAAADSAGDLIITNSGAALIKLNSGGTPLQTAVNTTAAGGSYYAGVVQILTPGNTIDITGGISSKGSAGAFSGQILLQAANVNVSGTIDTSNNALAANSVAIGATNSIAVADINTQSAVNGGLVSMAAGSAGLSGNIVSGNILTSGSGAGHSAGALVATASGDISISNVDLSGVGGAAGGTFRLVAGNSTSTGNISFGNVTTAGASGGLAAAVSLGVSGTISGGSITTDAGAANGIAGSFSLSTIGNVSIGAVSTRGLANGSTAGTVFISSGASSGIAITAPSINTSANNGLAGNVLLVYNSSNSANVPVITQTGSTAGYTFSGSPTTVLTDITGDTIVSFGPTGVNNFNPGGYNTANAPLANLTIDTGGDSRMFVPIVIRTGDVNLLKVTSAVTGGQASPLSVYATGNIQVIQGVNASSSSGAAPSIGFQSTTGTVNLNSIDVSGLIGGTVVISSPTNFTLANGASLLADGTGGGAAGKILISVPNGVVNLGSPGNSSSNVISASGGTGGVIQIESSGAINDYEVSIKASGATSGGTIKITSYENSVNLYNGTNGAQHYNASLDVSSVSGPGGTIEVNGKNGISVLNDGAIGPAGSNNSIWDATGSTAGGSISLTSSRGNINLAEVSELRATSLANGATGGVISILAPLGTVSSTVLTASGSKGGSISSISDSFYQPLGKDITATGTGGKGGSISLYTGGVRAVGSGNIQFGNANNTSGQKVDASGTTGGGTVTVAAGGNVIDYEVPILATAQTGKGGDISIGGGTVSLYHEYWNSAGTNFAYNANIDASSNSGTGGSIGIGGDLTSIRDTSNGLSGNTNTSFISANGTTNGGLIAIQGNTVNLAETLLVTANATNPGSVGGTIKIATEKNFNCCYGSTAIVSARGEATGGTINMNSNSGSIMLTSPVDASAVNGKGTGGTIIIAANQGNVETARLTASDSSGSVTASAGGSLKNDEVVTGDTILFQTVANSGSITFGKDITAKTSITASANGGGNILRDPIATLYSPAITLSSGTGNIGSVSGSPASSDPQYIYISGLTAGAPVNLTASTGGDVHINSLAPDTSLVGNSNAGTGNNVFQLESAGGINVTGSVTVGGTTVNIFNSPPVQTQTTQGTGSLVLETYANDGNITISGTAQGFALVSLSTQGNGIVTVLPGGKVSSTNNILIQAADVDLRGSVVSQGAQIALSLSGTLVNVIQFGFVTLLPNDSRQILLGNTGSTPGSFDVKNSEFGNIQTDFLLIGSTNTKGSITTLGDINVSGPGPAGIYHLQLTTAADITGTGHVIHTDNSKNITMIAGGTLHSGGIAGSGGPGAFNSIGQVSLSNTTNVGATGNVVVDGDINVLGGVNLFAATTADVLSSQSITSGGNVSVTGTAFTNAGTVTGVSASIQATSFTNTGNLNTTTGSITVTGTGTLQNSGGISSGKDIKIDLANISNTKTGTISASTDLTFTGQGTFTNAGSITAGATLTDGHPLIDNSGTMSGAGLLYAPSTSGTIQNTATGVISATTSLQLTKLAAITNDGLISSAGIFSIGSNGSTAKLQLTGTGNLSQTGTAAIFIDNSGSPGKDVIIKQAVINGQFDGKATGLLDVETTNSDLLIGSVSANAMRFATADANTLRVITSGGLTAGTLTLETGHAVLDSAITATTGQLTIDSRTGGLLISSTTPGAISIGGQTQTVLRAASGTLEFGSNLQTSAVPVVVDAQGASGKVQIDKGVSVQTGQANIITSDLTINGKLDTGFTNVGNNGDLSITNAGTWTTTNVLAINDTNGKLSINNSGSITTSATVFVADAGGSINISNTGTISTGGAIFSGTADITIDNAGGGATSGTINGDLTLFANKGNVGILQGTLTGQIGGLAAGSFAAETTLGTITASSITANSLRLSVPDAQTLTLPNTAIFTASSMDFQAGTVQVNNALSATGGTLTIESRLTPLTVSGTGSLSSTGGTLLKAASGDLNILNSLTATGALTVQANGAAGRVIVSAGTTIAGTTGLSVISSTLQNDGTVQAVNGDFTMTAAGNLIASGAGQILTTGKSDFFGTGTVSVTQSNITGATGGSAASTFDVASGSSLTLGDVKALTATFKTVSGNSSISVKGTVDAPTTSLTASGSGSISEMGGKLQATTLTLRSSGGDIGTGSTALATASTAIDAATTGSGNIYISNGTATSFTGSTGSGTLSVINSGKLTTGSLSGSVIMLQTKGSSDIVLGTGVTAGAKLDIDATAGGSITQSTGTIAAPIISLSSGTGQIGGASALATMTPSLTVTTGGDANISNTGVLTLTGSAANLTLANDAALSSGKFTATGNLALQANGDITTTGQVSAKTLSLVSTATDGNIVVGSSIDGTTSVTLTATGKGSITTTAAIGTGQVILTSATGDIGSALAPVLTSGSGLRITTSASAFISQSTVSTTLSKSDIGGKFNLVSSKDVATNGALAANQIDISTSAGANLSFGADATGTTDSTFSTAINGSLTVQSGATIGSSAGNALINSDHINNDGTIRAAGLNSQVSLGSATPGGTLTLGGTGTVRASNGTGKILVSAATVSLPGIQTFDTASVSVNGSTSVTVGGSLTVSNGAPLTVSTPQLTFGNNGKITAPGASDITVSAAASNLQIFAPDGSTGTIATNGALVLSAGNNITFGKTPGINTATLTLTGSSVSTTPGTGTVTINAGTIQQSTSDQTFNLTNMVNDGVLTSTGTTSLIANNSLTVSGTGSITGGTLSVSSNASVSISQGSITATLTGTANNNFSATTSSGALNVGSLTSTAGSVFVTNTTGALNILDGSTLSAAANVALTGGNALAIGTVNGGVTISAGQLAPQVNPNSTDMNDYDTSAITSAGGISLTTTSGNITVADGANLRTAGGNIAVAGPGNITLGNNQQFFAQGGDIWLNGLGNINVGGGNFTAVARNIPNGAPVYLPSPDIYIAGYQGGSIAFDVNSLQPSYDSYLRTNWEQQRQSNGQTLYSGAGISTAGSTLTDSNGGTVALVTSNVQKNAGTILNVLNSTISADGGVVYIDPPGSQVNLNNVVVGAFGPQLIAVPAPPPVPVVGGGGAGGGGPAAPAPGGIPFLSGLGPVASITESVAEGQKARIVPLDTLDLNVQIGTGSNKEQQCVPVPLARFAEVAREDGGWAVASGFCESFSIEGSNGSSIISAGGTQLAPSSDEKTLRMNKGKLIAMSGKTGLTVVAGDAKVSVGAESAMLIEETSKGVLRITQMAGSPGSVELERNGAKQTVPTHAGHEIIIAMNNAEAEELIPIDGIDRVPIGATMTVADLQVRRNQIDRKQLLQRDNLLNCSAGGCFPVRLRSRLNRMKAEVNVPAKKAPLTSMELSHPYKSVGFVQGAVPSASPLTTLASTSGIIKHTGEARFSILQPGTMLLLGGEILVAPERTTLVSCGTVRVRVKAGTVAVLNRETDGCVRVRALWEGASDDIVAFGGSSGMVSIRAGQEIVVAPSEADLNSFMKQDSVARRRVLKYRNLTGEAIMISEVSFLSSVNECDVLNALMKSANPDDKSISGKIVKMAVALSVATSKHGNYMPVRPGASN